MGGSLGAASVPSSTSYLQWKPNSYVSAFFSEILGLSSDAPSHYCVLIKGLVGWYFIFKDCIKLRKWPTADIKIIQLYGLVVKGLINGKLLIWVSVYKHAVNIWNYFCACWCLKEYISEWSRGSHIFVNKIFELSFCRSLQPTRPLIIKNVTICVYVCSCSKVMEEILSPVCLVIARGDFFPRRSSVMLTWHTDKRTNTRTHTLTVRVSHLLFLGTSMGKKLPKRKSTREVQGTCTLFPGRPPWPVSLCTCDQFLHRAWPQGAPDSCVQSSPTSMVVSKEWRTLKEMSMKTIAMFICVFILYRC